MGKYPNSEIHDRYSDWHWGLVKQDPKFRRLYVADIDRLWIEYNFRKNAVVAIFDIKWENSQDVGYSPTEKGIYDWFCEHQAPVYIVYISQDFTRFTVHDYSNPINVKAMSSEAYANWLLSLRGQY